MTDVGRQRSDGAPLLVRLSDDAVVGAWLDGYGRDAEQPISFPITDERGVAPYSEEHAMIIGGIAGLYYVGQPVNPITLKTWLEKTSSKYTRKLIERICYLQALGTIINLCESPIERLLADSLFPAINQMTGIQISPQWKFLNYRSDFCIKSTSDKALLAIECDGHDWHERTKSQARRDRARDRAFTRNNIRNVRFTGSEISCNPRACAAEVLEILASAPEWEDEDEYPEIRAQLLCEVRP
jgi:very-short-patch-repair endonuclease